MPASIPQPAPTQQPQLLDPDTAYAMVHQRVYSPVFFEKVARDFGIRPESEAEATQMLTMAAQLRLSYDQEQEKRASSQTGALTAAAAHLGVTSPEGSPGRVSAALVEKAAVDCAADPEIAHAVLSLQAASAGATPKQLV